MGDAKPSFSPDGKTLAYLHQRSDSYYELRIVPIAGGQARTITPYTARVYSFARTPDSRELAFWADYQGTRRIWRMEVRQDKAPVPVLGVGMEAGRNLTISRQGRNLAYVHNATDMNIWRLGLDRGRPAGTPQKAIASAWRELAPDFSPDGAKIVFVSDRSGTMEIWTCAADGSGPFQVTQMNAAPGPGSPRWSPDGRTIAFDSNQGQVNIYTVSADGGPVKRITDNPAWDAVPTWSRDGRWIYFSSDRSGDRQIWKVPAGGGVPVQVTRHGGVNAFESADGMTLYYAKDISARGLWKMNIKGGDETVVVNSPGPRRWGYMHVTAAGIYFLDVAGEANKQRDAIFFYDFSTRRTTQVAALDKPAGAGARGLALSPDGRSLLYPQVDVFTGNDLMLVQNFR